MSTTATALPTGTWNVDPAHSRVGFSVKHLGISTVRGEFRNYDSALVIGEDGSVTASGTVAVDSVDTNQPDRDGHLRSPDFFDAESHPEISFRSTSVVARDEETFEITGDLTLRGVTQPITLTAEIGGGETDAYGSERVGLDATGTISRSAFGVKFNQALGSGNAVVYRRFSNALERDFAKHHDAGHYADALAMPPAALSQALTQVVGKTTKELITDRVMLEAVRLLRFTDRTMGEIAYMTGFSDPLYFSRAFKRHNGEPPTVFRDRTRGVEPAG